jgi:hypothetical protein
VYWSFHNLDRGFIMFFQNLLNLDSRWLPEKVIVLTGQLCTVLCVCISVIYAVLCYCFGDFIRKYRTVGIIGPTTPRISPFIRGSTVLASQEGVFALELVICSHFLHLFRPKYE